MTAQIPANSTFHADEFAFGASPLSIDTLVGLAHGDIVADLSATARNAMQASADVVERLHAEGGHVYGVTTSVGHSVTTRIPPERSAEFSLNLLRMHGCGTGRKLEELESAAVLAARISSLSVGRSGVRPLVADRLITMLNSRMLPVIPSQGSVGASGDLTPLSYVAAVLAGEREVLDAGEVVPTETALRRRGLKPLELGPKEALALMNGTSVASAIGSLAWHRARRISRLAATVTAMVSRAINGNPTHFDSFVHASRPHDGQVLAAKWIREALEYADDGESRGPRLQDRYSIRCAPHIIGVLNDTLTFSRQWVETELNGVSDNPVVDVERGIVVHGGNFYGGHVGFAFDSLKTAVANIADLLDRQMMVVCNPEENDGLRANLAGVVGERACTHNGFKAVTIATSALAAEALKLTMPASAFSRSTELHNQDKVPMATIASRDLLRIVELTEEVLAMMLLAAAQALDLRGAADATEELASVYSRLRERVPRLVEDRRMDHDIAAVLELIRDGAFDGPEPPL